MQPKKWQKIFPMITNANSIIHQVIQIKNGIMKHANVNRKIIVGALS